MFVSLLLLLVFVFMRVHKFKLDDHDKNFRNLGSYPFVLFNPIKQKHIYL